MEIWKILINYEPYMFGSGYKLEAALVYDLVTLIVNINIEIFE